MTATAAIAAVVMLLTAPTGGIALRERQAGMNLVRRGSEQRTYSAGTRPTAAPARGGPQTTFKVAFALSAANSQYEVQVTPRCAGSASSYPWIQRVWLLGPPLLRERATIQLPRPLPTGWCTGRFRVGIIQLYPHPHRVAGGHFTVHARVRTPLPEKPCHPRGSKTLLRSRNARIFTIQVGRFTFTDGCLFAVRGHMQLASGFAYGDAAQPERQWLEPTVLGGPFVAYVLNSPGPADAESDVTVTDLRTGRSLWGHVGEAAALVLNPRTGAVAWIGSLEEAQGLGVAEVGPAGFTLLDAGNGIDTASLRFDGLNVSWKNAGVAKSAPL